MQMTYYMNNIGIGKHHNQVAKVSIGNVSKNLDETMKTIVAARLTKEESQKALLKVLNHNMSVEEAIYRIYNPALLNGDGDGW